MNDTQETALSSFMGSPEQSHYEGLALATYRAHKAREQGLCQSWAKLTGELEAINAELRSIDRTLKGGRGKAESEAERRSRAKARTATLRASMQSTSMQLMAVVKELEYVRGELARHEGAIYNALSPSELKAAVVMGAIPASIGERLAAARIDPKVVMFGVTQQDVIDCEAWDPWGEGDDDAR